MCKCLCQALYIIALCNLTLLHSERPKLYTILAFLSAVGLIELYIQSILDIPNAYISKYPQISNNIFLFTYQLLIYQTTDISK